MDDYLAFLRAKIKLAGSIGFDVADDEINPILKPHHRKMVQWMVRGGRRAVFASFGLGKTVVQLEAVRIILSKVGGRGLIAAPLGVRPEFARDAHMLATGESPAITDAQRDWLRRWQDGRPDRVMAIRFIRSIEEADETGIYISNFETIREGKLDPAHFAVASLDEASCLRGFGGTKTFREFMRLFVAVPYRFVATATPAPNEYIELLAYAAFLDIMDVGQAKTRFFKRNSEKADQLTIHPHKEREFWMWVASWGLFVFKPSDLGCPDEGYNLPPLEVRWHEVRTDHSGAGSEKSGQLRMFRNAALGVVEASAEKRRSLESRIAKLLELRAENPTAHRVIWHDLEAERAAIEKAIPGIASIYGTQDLEEREKTLIAFADGEVQELATKPILSGSGSNFQRHCCWEVFLGIGFKFNDIIQAVHRCYRFLQTNPVRIDLIYTEAEREVRVALERKWRQHEEMVKQMTEIVRKYGLSAEAMAQVLTRSLGVERVEITGTDWAMVNNDCVMELHRMPEGSVGFIVTSIPFGTQYEYSPNLADFGHTEDPDHFFQQMDFLVPELFRVLAPGRVTAIHVKDRVVPGGMTGLGFQTVYPFADDVRRTFMKHGFAYLGEKTNLTDVVRENNQTYRLGHSEQLKDGSRMGAGLPEKVLLFRRPQTDRSTGRADEPVVKSRPDYVDRGGNPAPYSRPADQAGKIRPVPGTGYSRARWQIDAHHLSRSSGDRLLAPEEWTGFDAVVIYRLWREHCLSRIYDFDYHVAIGEHLEARGKLPPTFMLLPPHSWHPDVWSDVAQMRSLNTLQAAANAEKHLCPLPFDIVTRLIEQFSMPGEVVLDPFAGIGSVPYIAIKLKRKAIGIELAPGYFHEAVKYCQAMEEQMSVPSLFDALAAEDERGQGADDVLEAV